MEWSGKTPKLDANFMKREFVLETSDSQMSATLKNAKDYILDASLLYKSFGLCILSDRSLFPLTGT